MKILTFILITTVAQQSNCWKPITHPAAFSVIQTFPDQGGSEAIARSSSNSIIHSSDHSDSLLDTFNKNDFTDVSCAVEKFALNHEARVKYSSGLAKLEQFTLCMWVRFTKHDGDHTLFTYSVHDEPREIQFWIANVNSSSFVSMAVRGHSLYRLNYPLGLKKWHHTCTSWNGKTGEWQLWIKSERVGRGFYNRLVSHEIEAGGNAFTGGKSPNGETAPGLHFEVTLLQVYSVALSAGKAHRDHKHHHAHKFDHNGEIEPTTTPAPPPVVNQPTNPLLANGQFPSRVRINLAENQAQAMPQPPATLNTNFVRGQFHTGARILQQQLLNINQQAQPQSFPPAQATNAAAFPATSSSSVRFPPSPPIGALSRNPNTKTISSSFTGFNQDDLEVIDEASLPNLRFKRQSKSDKKVLEKRDLVTLTDGSIVDDKFFDNDWFDGLAQFGDKGLKQSLTKRNNLEDEIKEHDREPAEGEVEAVNSYCNYCLVEPFQSALVLSWKDAVAEEDVLKAKASTICGDF